MMIRTIKLNFDSILAGNEIFPINISKFTIEFKTR